MMSGEVYYYFTSYFTLLYIISLGSVSSLAVRVCFCSLNADDVECVLSVYLPYASRMDANSVELYNILHSCRLHII